jgi:aminoglycoside phosphotransferase family enzyme/predicted kinase
MTTLTTGQPDPPAWLDARETHTAVVMLIGDRAYKMKKPVSLGFLDFTTREAREAVCHREVELNRRLAPGAYLGVWDVLDPRGEPCEHLVVMRRMPAERRLATLVRQGAEVSDELRHIAHIMAAFHSTAQRTPAISREGTRDAIRGRWMDSFAQVMPFRGGVLDDDLAGQIEGETLRFLAGRGPLFDRRLAEGRIVDGHGDLLAEDIFLLPDGPQLLDCIEFDDRLRAVDGLDDIAFLAMDLERLGQAGSGARLLDWYAEFAADPAPTSLRHHFVAYRAFVRAKVACLRHAQGGDAAGEAAGDVARHAELTAAHLRRGRVSLVLVGGAPATGKSTLAGALADQLGAVVISSDHVRKELAGLDPLTSAAAAYGEGIYTPQWTERTYAELLKRAEALLGLGESVVLDASWTRAAARRCAAAVAERTSSELVGLECVADRQVVAGRLRSRTGDASDADERVAERLRASADPWPAATTIDTNSAPDDSVSAAVAAVRGW